MSLALTKKVAHEISDNDGRKKFNAKLEYEFFNNFESPHTRKFYRLDITQFFNFITTHFPDVNNYHEVERVHVVAYRNFMNDKEQAPKTINRKIASVSSFYDFLVEKSIATFNPCHSIKRPKHQVQRPTNDLTDEQIRALFSKVDELSGDYLLHKAIIYLFFTTGIRKAELINLKIKDYSVSDGIHTIEIKAKGAKLLTKVIHPKTAEILDQYLDHLKTQAAQNGEEFTREQWFFRPTKNPLEPSRLIKPLNPKSVDYIVKTWCKRAGINHRVSPHSARASYIGSALDNGVDLYKISRDVGHASVKTTEEYNKRKQRISESPVWGLGFLKGDKAS